MEYLFKRLIAKLLKIYKKMSIQDIVHISGMYLSICDKNSVRTVWSPIRTDFKVLKSNMHIQ